MIHFFGDLESIVYAVHAQAELTPETIQKLTWLFGDKPLIPKRKLAGTYIGPRAVMVSPWSTNAVEITQNMHIEGIDRIEEYHKAGSDYAGYDPMLFQKFDGLDQDLFAVDITPEPVRDIADIAAYNKQEGLALNDEEVSYLEQLSQKLERPLTDSEVFGFSQVNSEHCRHKIFNGTFIVDGVEQPHSLFKLIRKTSEVNPNDIVSAYKDNVAFIKGPRIEQFAPASADKPDYYQKQPFDSVISLKAETHNFPTTVEPFNGAATGSGGEIRDRLAGGKGSIPLAGTAVYMTAYSRLEKGRPWEQAIPERPWLYQTPMDILIKASNGASDFGNKFGQPLIAGSVLTFEHEEHGQKTAYDKVIMLAGGIGYGKADQAIKDRPQQGDKIIVLGGDNYRIGMGGAAVSSADTGEFESGIELNAVQRSNPEMQKRAANAIRGLVESTQNPIVSIHDHGAGGHLNCLSELVEETGGEIHLDKLPVGDPTLSAKEIIGNESQERMGLIIGDNDEAFLERVAARERAPLYEVGEVTGDHRFSFKSTKTGEKPMDFELADMFGSSPKTVMNDHTVERRFKDAPYSLDNIAFYLEQLLQLEAVACKDWLTNKVDRCVTGRVAKQQCAGSLQLPLNNCGVMALDYNGKEGVATAIGHSPVSALVDPVAGSRNSVAEALTNLVWAPLQDGLKSVSLSANWMWPCNNEGEDVRLFAAVQGISDFAIALGINIPTGKDSLSMKQKYPDGEVLAPGTVIVSAAAHCDDIKKVVEPVARPDAGSIYYLNLSGCEPRTGGSSFAQILNVVGSEVPTVMDADYFKNGFNAVQGAIKEGLVAAGHDIASGGLITSLLEMLFAETNLGMECSLDELGEDLVAVLFSENAGLLIQASDDKRFEAHMRSHHIDAIRIGKVDHSSSLGIKYGDRTEHFDVNTYRDLWFKTSYLLDRQQSGADKAKERFDNFKLQPRNFRFPEAFDGILPSADESRPRLKAAILREKGSNSEREMAHAMFLAGFDVKDVHMTDLISGREDLSEIRFIAAVGGFSNSDVLGSAKGWAGAFKYNQKANDALYNFFQREDTLSLGVCNGCQLFVELGLINPEDQEPPKMLHNDTNKFECTFTSIQIQENNSVMLSSLAGTTLGIWSAHGEGKFSLPLKEEHYHIVGKYAYDKLPANPNGSDYQTAAMADRTGRHLVMMPHLERSIFPWNWGVYPGDRNDEVSPWIEAFVNARKWLETH